MAASTLMVEFAEGAGLQYTTDSDPGIVRRATQDGFSYWHPTEGLVNDPDELERIAKLAIPPAYRNVWICLDPNGHLQATGIDAQGRKQYRYHPLFREARDENKFRRMHEFGKVLPTIRTQIEKDFRLRGLPKHKVLAVVVYLLEKSLVRVGNDEYAKENNSFGLTTMQNRHVRVAGASINFNFMGKSGIRHKIEIHDKRLARVIKKVQDLPGQELFQYMDDEGKRYSISSADVNSYLREISGEHFTAKDFRTWWGTLLSLAEFAKLETPETDSKAKRAISGVMKAVSKHLGNTPAICRKCYVHPMVVNAYKVGSLPKKLSVESGANDPIETAESALLEMFDKASHSPQDSHLKPRSEEGGHDGRKKGSRQRRGTHRSTEPVIPA